MNKLQHKNKDEKRRLLLNKKYVKHETRIAKYGSDSVAVVAMDFNRRFVAAFLALVFVLTTLVIGYNLSVKAVTGDEVALDGTYSNTYASSISHTAEGRYLTTRTVTKAPSYKATVIVNDGEIQSVSVSCDNLYGVSSPGITTGAEDRAKYNWDNAIKNGIDTFLNSKTSGYYVDAKGQLQGKPATYDSINTLVLKQSGSSDTELADPNTWQQFVAMREALFKALQQALKAPPYIDGADDYNFPTPPPLPEPVENTLKVNKWISPSSNGLAYDLTLESYSTADLGMYQVQENVPTDYILVIDQSGSMARRDMPRAYEAPSEPVTLEQTAQDKYYYYDGENTYRVFPVQDYLYYLIPGERTSGWAAFGFSNDEYVGYFMGDLLDLMGIDRSWFSSSQDVISKNYANRIYYKDGTVFRPIITSVGGKLATYYCKFDYYDENGDLVTLQRSDRPYYKNILNGDIYGPDTGILSAFYGIVNGAVGTLNLINAESTLDTYTLSEAEVLFTTVRTGMYINEYFYQQKVGYTKLCYRDNEGNIHTVPSTVSNPNGNGTIEEAIYCDANGNAVSDAGSSTRITYNNLMRGKNYETRLDTLETALQVFQKTVEKDVDSFGQVDNRIAIVGFSGHAEDGQDNTEILTNTGLGKTADLSKGISEYTKKRYTQYGRSTNHSDSDGSGYWYFPDDYNYIGSANDYQNALLRVKDDTQSRQIDEAIGAITAYGGTQPEDGLDLAIGILEAHKSDTYIKQSGSDKNQPQLRNKVVIFFTDGQPGDYSTSDQIAEANEVVEKAAIIKQEYGAQVFSIGVFGESDLTPLTYPGHPTTTDPRYGTTADSNYEYEDGYFKKIPGSASGTFYLYRDWLTTYGASEDGNIADTDTIFDYMSVVSSNYPEAELFVSEALAENHSDDTSWSEMIEDVRGTRNQETNSDGSLKNYYRLAANQQSLIEAFRSAATVTQGDIQPESGTLSANPIIRDVINTGDFDIPEDAHISIILVPGDYVANSDPTFRDVDAISYEQFNQANSTNISYRRTSANTIDVSGFNFNDYYIANRPEQGYKIQIIIEGVTPNRADDELLSNEANPSGVYSADPASDDPEIAESAELVVNFPTPSIARYKYDLDVGDDDTTATFDVDFSLTHSEGDTTGFGNILVSDSNGRALYNNSALKNWASAEDGKEIYLEYITANGLNGTVDPEDYTLSATVTPSTNANTGRYTYYLDTEDTFNRASPDSTKVLDDNGRIVSLPTTSDGTLYVDSITRNHPVTITLDAERNQFIELDTEFSAQLTLTGDGLDQATIAALNTQNSGSGVSFTWNSATETATATITWTPFQGNPPKTAFEFEVPDGATLSVIPSIPSTFTPGVPELSYTQGDETQGTELDPTSNTLVIDDSTDYVIKATPNEIVVTGVSENKNSDHVLLYILAGMTVVSGGAGAAYVYRKKDEFAEE